MASSTTKPTAMVSAISDRLSRLKCIRYIAANEPASAKGTVTLGMSVAQKLRRNRRITITTRQMVSTKRELDVGHRGADRHGAVENGFDLDRRRNARGELRQLRLDLVDGVDDVGAGLLEHGEDDAVAVVLIAGDGAVDLIGHRLADVAHPDRRAVAVGQHDVVVFVGVGESGRWRRW